MYEYECMYSISKRFVRSRWLVLFHQMYPLLTQWISYKQNIWPFYSIQQFMSGLFDRILSSSMRLQIIHLTIKMFTSRLQNYLWMREGVCFLSHRERSMWGMLYMVQSNPVQGTLLYMGIVFRWTTAPRLGAPCWGRRVQSRGRGGGVARPSQARLPRCQQRGSVLDKHVQCPHLECLSLG